MTRSFLVAFIFMSACLSQVQTPVIDQTNGVDPSVDYLALAKLGPWDDCNYQLTAQDLLVLSEFESEAKSQIPAFYRVLLRKRYPSLPRRGSAQYPRSAPERFHMEFGGFMVNGTLIKEDAVSKSSENFAMLAVPFNAEVQLNLPRAAG